MHLFQNQTLRELMLNTIAPPPPFLYGATFYLAKMQTMARMCSEFNTCTVLNDCYIYIMLIFFKNLSSPGSWMLQRLQYIVPLHDAK